MKIRRMLAAARALLPIALLLDPIVATADDGDPTTQELGERIDALEEELAELRSGEDRGTVLRGFGHVGFSAQNADYGDPIGDVDANAFANGGLDLFITSRISDRLSFLNETVFEPTEEGENVLDVERLIFKIHFNDHFNLQMGRVHTTLGYWNEAFHHGEWLQASIGRPRVFDFEDEDGLLPVHLVGLVAKGRFSGAPGAFSYSLEIGNGRAATPDPPQIVADANEQKAFNTELVFEPAPLLGLKLGGGFYRDTISPFAGSADYPQHGRMDEHVLSGFVAYEHRFVELLADYVEIVHDGSGTDASSSGYYVQLAVQHADLRPFVRVDAIEIDDSDNFFGSNDDLMRVAGGVRWDYSAWSALKIQVERSTIEQASGDPDVETLSVLLQNAFAF